MNPETAKKVLDAAKDRIEKKEAEGKLGRILVRPKELAKELGLNPGPVGKVLAHFKEFSDGRFEASRISNRYVEIRRRGAGSGQASPPI